jgi:hypothetical protein
VPHKQNATVVSCSYFSSSHWLFASILLILRPSPMSQFLSHKLGHQPLSHWNQWKFSVTKVLRMQGVEGVRFQSRSPRASRILQNKTSRKPEMSWLPA